MRRLTMKVDGDDHHYCLSCGNRFLATGIKRLQAILTEVNTPATQG
jgi:hypothetical protein